MAYRTIYLIRHGQYNPEVEAAPDGNRLSEVGRTQSEATADFLADVPFTAIHVSTMDRALETAAFFSRHHPHLPLQKSELLEEITPPLPYLAIKNLKDISPEQMRADKTRIEEAYSAYFIAAGEEDEYEAIICHGNVIRYLVCRVLQISPLIWMNFEIYNCSISMVEIDQHGNSILLSYNESGHLEEVLKTQNLSPMGIGRKYAEADIDPKDREEAPAEHNKV